MKKLTLYALLLAALVSLPAHGQDVGVRTAVLAYSWDMDGEAADADQIVEAAGGVIVDNGTSVGGVNYTITAQPDSCRLIDMTISDTNMTAGTITVNGTDCLGYPRTCTWSAWTAGDDDGVKTLTVTVGPTGSSCYLKTVTSITTGTMTGESDEFFTLGYTTNSADAWTMFGIPGPDDALGRHSVDPWNSFAVPLNITTSGVATTAVTSVAANAAFTNVAAGDLLLISIGGREYQRKVVTRADADNIVVNQAIKIPAAGVPFRYKKFYYSTDPYDDLWIPVQADSTTFFNTNVAVNTSTGGVVQTLYCTIKGAGWPTTNNFTVATETTASAAAAKFGHYINLNLIPYTHCKMAFKYGTGDQAGTDDITLTVTERRY